MAASYFEAGRSVVPLVKGSEKADSTWPSCPCAEKHFCSHSGRRWAALDREVKPCDWLMLGVELLVVELILAEIVLPWFERPDTVSRTLTASWTLTVVLL